MKKNQAFQSRTGSHNLVHLARLVMDYETDPDFANGDLQKGVLKDMLKVIKADSRQLLEILPSLPVARALFLGAERGMYTGKLEGELLFTATYHCISRAMEENPGDNLLYFERFKLMKYTELGIHRFLETVLRKNDRFKGRISESAISKEVLKAQVRMLLVDFLYGEEFIMQETPVEAEKRDLINILDSQGEFGTPLYQHLNIGLETHWLLKVFLEDKLKSDELCNIIWFQVDQ